MQPVACRYVITGIGPDTGGGAGRPPDSLGLGLVKRFDALIAYFLPPPEAAVPADERYRGKILVISCAAAFVLILPFVPIRMALHGADSLFVALLVVALAGVTGAPFLYKRTQSVVVAGLFVVAFETVVLVAYAVIDGGMYSASIVWFPILPVFTVFYAGWGRGVWVGLAMVLSLLVISAGHSAGMFLPTDTLEIHVAIWGLSTVSVLVLLMLLAWAYLEWQGRIQAELVASCEARDHFLGTISHELRTPLNAVVGLSALLRKGNAGPLTKEQSEYVADISTSADQLLGLVNEVLDFSRIRAGGVSANPLPSDVGALLHTWVAPFVRESHERNIDLRIEAPDRDRLRQVWIDPIRFRQAVFNLITNAIKFTPRGGRITVGADVQADWLRLWVEDTGIGIPRDELGRVFEDFYQTEHGKRTMTSNGTGLGLAVTRRIVALHGGTVDAESDGPGRGSRFVIRVPADPMAARRPPLAGTFKQA